MGESILCSIIKIFSYLLRLLPLRVALTIGKAIGYGMFIFSTKRKRQVYLNLRKAFAKTKSDEEIKQIILKVFTHFAQNFIEIALIPSFSDESVKSMVTIEGEEFILKARAQKRGLIMLTMHYGNWEMANQRLSVMEINYKMFKRDQHRHNKLDALLNTYRSRREGDLIDRDANLRGLIRSLKNNEMVGMVGDQGGKTGVLVDFFSRKMSLSKGPMKLAMKSHIPLLFGVIRRKTDGNGHRLLMDPPLELQKTGNREKDLEANLTKVASLMERRINEAPWEYMWFYKIWKYSRQRNILILNDGRTGHLRQSEMCAKITNNVLKDKGYTSETACIKVEFQNAFKRSCFALLSPILVGMAGYCKFDVLRHFLKEESMKKLSRFNADVVISTGSVMAGVNYCVGQDNNAKRFVLQKSGMWPTRHFDAVIIPQHDARKRNYPGNVLVTHGAPNKIDETYLKEQGKALRNRFSHLKQRNRTNIGLFIGGESRHIFISEHQTRVLVHQLKGIAKDLNADLLVTTSRRTPKRIETILYKELKKDPSCPLLIIANEEKVPEAVGGILDLSEIVIVSADSISMVCEAAASGKNVITFLPEERVQTKAFKNKHRFFINRMHNRGFVLSSDVQNIGRTILDVQRGKVKTRKLDDCKLIHERINKHF